jgi:predicted transcriptional regulator
MTTTSSDRSPTLPDLEDDERISGWMFDTEPALPPDLLVQEGVMATPIGELARRVRSVSPTATVLEVARAVVAQIDAPVVIVDGGRPLGVVRATDVVRALLARSDRREALATTIMSSAIFCLRDDAPLARAVHLLAVRGASEALVIDAAGTFVGMVTPADIARALAAEGHADPTPEPRPGPKALA